MKSEFGEPLDPLYLVSRRLDGDLTPEEARALDAALAVSAALRGEAERLSAAQVLIARWAEAAPCVDDAELTRRILSSVRAAAAERESADGVDAVLRRWARPVVFDEQTFTAGVAARLRAEAQRRRWRGVYRLGVPLALAAAAALAVTATLWTSARPVVEVAIGPGPFAAGAAAALAGEADAVVVFVREAADERLARRDAPAISLLSVGAEPMANGEEIPPL